MFIELQRAINDLVEVAPKDHDIILRAFDLTLTNVFFAAPHTFICHGYNSEGDATFAVCHFSQMLAKVVYSPKRGPERIVTGFATDKAI